MHAHAHTRTHTHTHTHTQTHTHTHMHTHMHTHTRTHRHTHLLFQSEADIDAPKPLLALKLVNRDAQPLVEKDGGRIEAMSEPHKVPEGPLVGTSDRLVRDMTMAPGEERAMKHQLEKGLAIRMAKITIGHLPTLAQPWTNFGWPIYKNGYSGSFFSRL